MKKIIPLLFFVFLSLPAYAVIHVSQEVDKPIATLEDEIILTITISGQGASEPTFPSMPAFKVIPSGTSSNFQIINGQMSFRKSYSYVLIPQSPGSHRIDSVSVMADGVEYKSNPLVVNIDNNMAQNQRPIDPSGRNQDPYFDENTNQQQQDESIPGEPRYWIEVDVSDSNPYVNEQILYTFRFYTNRNIGGATLTLPEFKDFWSEEVVAEKKGYQNINGERFVVSEKILALYPLRSGVMDIDQTHLRVQVPDEVSPNRNHPGFFDDPFFGFTNRRMVTKNLKSNPIKMEIKALPQDKPENFSNLVGHFQMTTSMSDYELKQGDTTTLTVEISGDGNIKDAVIPNSLDFKNFKVYDDKPQINISKNESGISGTKTFKKALVPLKSGKFDLPEIQISYFDPVTEDFVEMKSSKVELTVLKNENENLGVVATDDNLKSDIQEKSMPKDIAAFHTDIKIEKKPGMASNVFLVLLYFVPPTFVMLSWLMMFQKSYRSKNWTLLKSQKAYRNFVNNVHKNMTAIQLLEAIRIYLGDKFQTNGLSLTPKDMQILLLDKIKKTDLVTQFIKIVAQLEALSYGGSVSMDLNKNHKNVLEIVKQIDNEI